MPSVKDWASYLPKTISRESSCRHRSSLLDPYSRRSSETSLSNMDVNDSERTLVGTLEVEDVHLYATGQRQMSTTSTNSQHQGRRSSKGGAKDSGSIECRVDYCVVEDAGYAVQLGNYTGVWAGEMDNAAPQTRTRYFGDHIHQNAYNAPNKA